MEITPFHRPCGSRFLTPKRSVISRRRYAYLLAVRLDFGYSECMPTLLYDLDPGGYGVCSDYT